MNLVRPDCQSSSVICWGRESGSALETRSRGACRSRSRELAGVVRQFFEKRCRQIHGLAVFRLDGDDLFGVIERALLVVQIHFGFHQRAINRRAPRRVGILHQVSLQIFHQSGGVVPGLAHHDLQFGVRIGEGILRGRGRVVAFRFGRRRGRFLRGSFCRRRAGRGWSLLCPGYTSHDQCQNKHQYTHRPSHRRRL